MSATPLVDAPHDLNASCTALAQRARAVTSTLALSRGAARDRWLLHVAAALEGGADTVLEANARDLDEAAAFGLAAMAQLDRLRLTPTRLAGMAQALRTVASLPDP